ncbi:hypothetical protein ANCDUO_13030 [Ancylostoma duodenale]|uniref:Pao retrotransposon peptidase n=1 Tax=Ancylostoma duodenale TaxID=51022 RepID=A0A0C2D420_9BILA|nr:hypothetical protein ANCDUO_13030 [Ancylostoma duodenale]
MPRFLAPKFSTVMLITFADASSEAMASCVYLRSDNAVNLLMAKRKLPPLDSKVTVPKLELNAMTLGMRLTNSVVSQLSSAVTISRVLILSDSEIALNWIKSTPRHDVGPFVKNRVTERSEDIKYNPVIFRQKGTLVIAQPEQLTSNRFQTISGGMDHLFY